MSNKEKTNLLLSITGEYVYDANGNQLNLRKIMDDVDTSISVRDDRKELLKDLQECQTRHAKELDEINSKLDRLQILCPHFNVEYFPDTSGNNDSYYYCNDCKAESETDLKPCTVSKYAKPAVPVRVT